ncbi:hypothetical protein KY284_030368 [Solanum tuberosum]|nr:hypothetical protein KY284_030368 [Solanum tuberosum]
MVWKHFCGPIGINVENMQLSQLINLWWEIDAHHQIKYIFQVVLSIIVWELWKRRNTIRHGNKISSNKVIYQIMHTLIQFMKTRRRNCTYIPYKWAMVVEAIHNYNPTVKVTRVIWRPPATGWIKVNTDGVSKRNLRRSSWGFCVRNNKGDIIQAQAKEIDEPLSTNTQAETMALLNALNYIKTAQLDKVIIETDSLVLKNIVERVWKVPWKVVNILEEIWKLMQGKTLIISHNFRERNKLADYLANLALEKGTIQVSLAHGVDDVHGGFFVSMRRRRKGLFWGGDFWRFGGAWWLFGGVFDVRKEEVKGGLVRQSWRLVVRRFTDCFPSEWAGFRWVWSPAGKWVMVAVKMEKMGTFRGGGDFNVILNDEEKIGGLPVYPQEYENFAFCVTLSLWKCGAGASGKNRLETEDEED